MAQVRVFSLGGIGGGVLSAIPRCCCGGGGGTGCGPCDLDTIDITMSWTSNGFCSTPASGMLTVAYIGFSASLHRWSGSFIIRTSTGFACFDTTVNVEITCDAGSTTLVLSGQVGGFPVWQCSGLLTAATSYSCPPGFTANWTAPHALFTCMAAFPGPGNILTSITLIQ